MRFIVGKMALDSFLAHTADFPCKHHLPCAEYSLINLFIYILFICLFIYLSLTLLKLAIDSILKNCTLIDILHFKYLALCVCV